MSDAQNKRDQIVEIAAQHPTWGGTKIAKIVGCHPGHARRVVSEFRRAAADRPERPEKGAYRVGVIGDIHCPYHDEQALEIALDFIASKDVDEIVVLGDLVDFYQISSWKPDPERMPFAEEVEACGQMLAHIASRFPRARKTLVEGNHEMRLFRFLCSGNAQKLKGLPSLDLPELIGLHSAGFDLVVNRDLLEDGERPFQIGKLFFAHGHEIRVSYSAVNIPRLYYLKSHVNLLVAHHHRTQEYLTRLFNHEHEGAWSVGALCNLSPQYAPSNEWNHGFAVVYFDEDGDFAIKNRKIIKGKVL